MKYTNKVYLASVTDKHPSSTVAKLAYQAELESDFDSGVVNCSDPRAYKAKFKTYNEENPSYNMTTTGEYSSKYQRAMVK